MENKCLVVDVTTLLKWNRSPVGIIRTQLEFVSYLLKNDDSAIYCRFNDTRDNLETVTFLEIKQVVQKLKSFKNEPQTNKPIKSISLQEQEQEQENSNIKKALFYYRQYGLKELMIKICKLKCPSKVKNILKKIYRSFIGESSFSSNELGKHDANEKTFGEILFAPEIYQTSQLECDFLNENTIFVSVGLDWDYSNYPLLYWLKKKYKFQFIGSFYDGIPVENPELVQSYYFSQMFFNHIYYLVHLSDKIFCISDFSKKQLSHICKKHNIEQVAILETIHLGDSVYQDKTIKEYPKRNHKDNYVLYVSTIESRKNHVLLLKVWQELKKQKFEKLPDLVLIGMMGWGVSEFQDIYYSDNGLQKIVHLYHDVDDEELVLMYKKARFTVFPSFTEGWGLGAVESLLYRKPCIISDCEALIEATQGLMPSLSPNSIDKWSELIKLFSEDDVILKKYENIIDSKFMSRSWKFFSRDFYRFLKDTK